MANTGLVALTSPDCSSNYISRLSELKESDGSDETFFTRIDCILICDDCRKLDKEKMFECNHVKQEAFWISSQKVKRMKRVYATNPALGIRELTGAIEDDHDPCFDKDDLARLFSAPHVSVDSVPRQIIISVDPAGGGVSKLAISSGYYDNHNRFIVSSHPYIILMAQRLYKISNSVYYVVFCCIAQKRLLDKLVCLYQHLSKHRWTQFFKYSSRCVI